MKVLLVEDYATLSKSVSKAVKEMGWAIDTAKGSESSFHFSNPHPFYSARADSAVDQVVVAYYKLWCTCPWKCFYHLLSCPSSSQILL